MTERKLLAHWPRLICQDQTRRRPSEWTQSRDEAIFDTLGLEGLKNLKLKMRSLFLSKFVFRVILEFCITNLSFLTVWLFSFGRESFSFRPVSSESWFLRINLKHCFFWVANFLGQRYLDSILIWNLFELELGQTSRLATNSATDTSLPTFSSLKAKQFVERVGNDYDRHTLKWYW